MFADQLFQQGTGLGGGFAHLHHHPVARRQGGDDGHHGQLDRVVPGHDDTHHAQGLVFHPGLARPAQGADAAFAGLHPLAQLFGGVFEPFQGNQDFRQAGLVRSPVGEVRVDGLNPVVGMFGKDGAQAIDQLDALFRSGVRVLAECGFLSGKYTLHALDFGVALMECFHFGDHGPRLPSLIVV